MWHVALDDACRQRSRDDACAEPASPSGAGDGETDENGMQERDAGDFLFASDARAFGRADLCNFRPERVM